MQVSEKRIRANKKNALAPNSGRPLGAVEESTAYAKAWKLYVARLVEENKAPLAEAMLKEALAGNVNAFTALLDRAHGKPAQAVEMSGKDGQPIVFMPLELIQKHALKVIEGTESDTQNTAKNIELIDKPL